MSARSVPTPYYTLFICVRATPNAYCQISERLHTFFFYTRHPGAERQKKQTITMVRVDVSVFVEPTVEWRSNFENFMNELQHLKWMGGDGIIRVPNENHFEELFNIARKYDLRIILHS